jgi:hypothetical protein
MSKRTDTTTPDRPFHEEWVSVADLQVDPRIQRSALNGARVDRMVANYNRDAMGLVTVSDRGQNTLVIVDGWHRWETERRYSENTGKLYCRIFTGLSLPEEAQLFLDLNQTNKPLLVDKFRVRVQAQDAAAMAMAEILNMYQWKLDPRAADHHVNAVGAVERLYTMSQMRELEPNLLQSTILVITRAWGHDRFGVQGPVLEGIGRVIGEYQQLDLEMLVQKLKSYKGGPSSLMADAKHLASIRRLRTAMAVADVVVNTYNTNMRKNTLRAWSKRA